MDLHRKIFEGDVLEQIKNFEDESIDVVVTSPIYYKMRDYKVEGQWGSEPHFNEYLDKMITLTKELKRVLKKTGTMWINIGDSYGSHRSAQDWINTAERNDQVNPHQIIPGFDSSRLLIPYRYAIRCKDEVNLGIRNDIIWEKPNALPTSLPDKFQNTFEYIYFMFKNHEIVLWQHKITKQWIDKKPLGLQGIEDKDWIWQECIYCFGTGIFFDIEIEDFIEDKQCEKCKGTGERKRSLWHGFKYYFNLDAVREDPKTKIQPSFNIRIRDGKKGLGYAKMGDDPRAWHLSTIEDLAYDKRGVKKQDITLGADGKPILTLAGFNRRYKYKHLEDQPEIHKAILDRIAYFRKIKGKEHNSAITHPLGKNPGDVWHITHKHFKNAHFATYPVELVERIIACACPKDGIVLDPFLGSGTTAIAAELLNVKWCGIELNPDYIRMAKQRLLPYLHHKLSEFF